MINYNPKIAQGGLVIDLDAGNPRSYAGTGSVWTNIAPEGIASGAMAAGITFNTMNGGCLYFTGTTAANQQVTLGAGSLYFPFIECTTETWIKTSGLGVGQDVSGIWNLTFGNQVYVQNNGTILYTTYNHIAGNPNTCVTTGVNVFDGTWHHIVSVSTGYIDYIFVDGIQRATTTAIQYGYTPWGGNWIGIGKDDNNSNFNFNGYIAQARMYKRALSVEEIVNNFNAYRGRFGI